MTNCSGSTLQHHLTRLSYVAASQPQSAYYNLKREFLSFIFRLAKRCKEKVNWHARGVKLNGMSVLRVDRNTPEENVMSFRLFRCFVYWFVASISRIVHNGMIQLL